MLDKFTATGCHCCSFKLQKKKLKQTLKNAVVVVKNLKIETRE